MTYANEHYPEMTEHFQSILKCVYPVMNMLDSTTAIINLHEKHTLWVENYLKENSQIINSAVKMKNYILQKCHSDHNKRRSLPN